MAKNTLKQSIVNAVEAQVKIDKAVNKSSGQQSVSRRSIAVLTSLYVVKLMPSLADLDWVVSKEDKQAFNKELFPDLESKSKSKIGQICYKPEMLKLAKEANGDLETYEKLIAEKFTVYDEDGKAVNDVSTQRGLTSALPKEDQGKVSKSEEIEADLKLQTTGDSVLFLAIFRDLLKKSTSQLVEIKELMDSQGQPEIENVILQPDVIDAISKKMPIAMADWIKQ